MTNLPIRIIPDPVLREKTTEVVEFSPRLHTFLNDMFETMEQAAGLGLAAPQVGVSWRVAVIDARHEELLPPTIRDEQGNEVLLTTIANKGCLELVNPHIVSQEQFVSSDEGCLSIPGYRETIKRKKRVKVKFQDRNGKYFELEAEDLLAFCLQHEIDHLDGVLFVDHLSRLKRHSFQRWYDKNMRPPQG